LQVLQVATLTVQDSHYSKAVVQLIPDHC